MAILVANLFGANQDRSHGRIFSLQVRMEPQGRLRLRATLHRSTVSHPLQEESGLYIEIQKAQGRIMLVEDLDACCGLGWRRTSLTPKLPAHDRFVLYLLLYSINC